MKIIHRKWTDFEKWFMGIIGALIVAVLIAIFLNGNTPCRPTEEIALLLGYEAAFGLKKSVGGQDIENERGLVNGYLQSLNLNEIQYPVDPSMNQGKSANDFAQRVMGRLKPINDKSATAFFLGWQGVISLDTPSKRPPQFDVNALAVRAGFPNCEQKSEKDCLNWLAERARTSRGPICPQND